MPFVKSVLAPSVMVIGPSVVHAGEGALEAVSAEMVLPPDAPVMVTVAKTELTPARKSPAISVSRVKDVNFFIICLPQFFGSLWSPLTGNHKTSWLHE